MYRSHVLVCGGTGCTSSGSQQIIKVLQEEIDKNGLTEEVAVVQTGCHGLCAQGPIMLVYPEGTFYAMVKAEDVPEIVAEHLLKGRVVDRLLYVENSESGEVKPLAETDFYSKQHRIALRNCGVINPENIEEYIGTRGYEALGKVLTEMTPEQVIDTILASGLRGRGGAGFPTGRKWQLARTLVQDGGQKYVCCNADEGDPGAFMDRSVLEGDPHALIEAMAIAGYAIGANQGYIYVRAEYPIAVDRLNIAIKQAREYGLLGKNIFDTGFDFDIELRLGAGAFVCGEETALMTSIEGNRGEPRPRPPFPAVKGLFERPTILNNVETWANIPQIILNGPEWFASMGTEKSKGTKVFALGGKINNTGLVEIPMGTTLREVIEGIGGGIPNGKKFKAAQTGGPSGGCIPAEHFDIPIDYDNLLSIGSMMGGIRFQSGDGESTAIVQCIFLPCFFPFGKRNHLVHLVDNLETTHEGEQMIIVAQSGVTFIADDACSRVESQNSRPLENTFGHLTDTLHTCYYHITIFDVARALPLGHPVAGIGKPVGAYTQTGRGRARIF